MTLITLVQWPHSYAVESTRNTAVLVVYSLENLTYPLGSRLFNTSMTKGSKDEMKSMEMQEGMES